MTLTSDAPSRGPAGGGPAGTASGNGRRAPTLAVVAVAAVLAAGVVLRFWTRSDLWLDEALSVDIARLPLHDLHQALRHDGAPPLYYLLLHVWTGVFGTSDLAVRALSGAFGVASLVAVWYAGRRIGGRTTAWASVLVLAANPYAIRYATETRMYGLEILLVLVGILAFRRAYERPDLGRLATLAVVVALLCYTQYWAFYLLGVAGLLLVVLAWRGSDPRAARRMLGAFAVGGLAFVPWLPTFLYQSAHTGTPWGTPVMPGVPIGQTIRDFAGGAQQEGYLLQLLAVVLVVLGVFGRGTDDRHVELDLRTRPAARWEALVGAATLVVGTSASYVAGSAFQTRYSAVMFPFFVLVVAHGITTFTDARIRTGALVVVVGLGLVGGGRNVVTNRTQAGEVAAVLRADAHQGDVVVYCPDQLGPAVSRLAPSSLTQLTYPTLGNPHFVDWVDYVATLHRYQPAQVADEVRRRAGPHVIWLVTAPGYTTHVGICDAFQQGLVGDDRTEVARVVPDDKIFEKPGLVEIAPKR